MRLDGNAAGGLLTEVFAADVTAAHLTCDHCGAMGAVGAAEAYMDGPGTVLRCPACEGVLLRVVRIHGRMLLDRSGVRTLTM
jgi:NAD-dependent SIR2 family protein deacetylase